VWRAAGHVENFSDPLVDCKECKQRIRADHVEPGAGCPYCGAPAESLTEPREFNLLFRTHVGPMEDMGMQAYLRPETAQGAFINFANVLASSRRKLPLGIAQIGRAFRNEISPGQFLFRTREFEQMELVCGRPLSPSALLPRLCARLVLSCRRRCVRRRQRVRGRRVCRSSLCRPPTPPHGTITGWRRRGDGSLMWWGCTQIACAWRATSRAPWLTTRWPPQTSSERAHPLAISCHRAALRRTALSPSE
jgi:hypothetical protein